jgi:hypothetical protein
MTTDEIPSENPQVVYDNLLDFLYDPPGSEKLYIEVGVKDDGKVAVFHNKKFKRELAWIEYDMDAERIDFVMDDGQVRTLGLPVNKDMNKYLHNTHQVLMVLMNEETGQATEGYYIPLIIHKM